MLRSKINGMTITRIKFLTALIVVTMGSVGVYQVVKVDVPPYDPANGGIFSVSGLEETGSAQEWVVQETLRGDLMQQSATRDGVVLLLWSVLVAILLFFRYANAGLIYGKYVLVALFATPLLGMAHAMIFIHTEGGAYTVIFFLLVSFITTPVSILPALFKKAAVDEAVTVAK